MTEAWAERVLVVPTAIFHRLGHFQGFSSDVGRYLPELLRSDHVSYRPRTEVEGDPGFKQLIPYVIFCHAGPDGRLSIFQYTRGTGMGEGRLHRKRSIGVGGHISSRDSGGCSAGSPYEEGMRRELEEEVIVEESYRPRCVGLINDDQSDVGRVHLGLVHRADLVRPAVRPRETDIIDSAFRPVEQLLADPSGFETWSQICLSALFGAECG
jgi:predicted NUDIX family phosphoesterase